MPVLVFHCKGFENPNFSIFNGYFWLFCTKVFLIDCSFIGFYNIVFLSLCCGIVLFFGLTGALVPDIYTFSVKPFPLTLVFLADSECTEVGGDHVSDCIIRYTITTRAYVNLKSIRIR